MIIYSVSIAIDKTVEPMWLDYMTKEHIDDVMKTGHFQKVDFRRVVEPKEASRSHYSIEYYCETMAHLEAYQAQDAARLQADHTAKFEGHFEGSRRYMEVL